MSFDIVLQSPSNFNIIMVGDNLPVVRQGRIRVFNGQDWVLYPVRARVGVGQQSNWALGRLKHWDGSQWVLTI